jgi:hypothetical protein
MLNKALRIFTLLAVALVILAACSLDANPTPIPSVTQTPPFPRESLVTYTNAAYGYAIEYPNTVTFEGDGNSDVVWIDDQISIAVSTVNPEEPQGDAPLILTAQPMSFGIFTARRLNGTIGAVGGNVPQSFQSVVVSHNDAFYNFTVYELKRTVTGPADRIPGSIPRPAIILFNYVVSTLRFTR